MTTHKKEQIINIIKDGQKAAEQLSEQKLKKVILGHFHAMQVLMNSNFNLDELEALAKRLTIGIKEALDFKDTELLKEVEVFIREGIGDLSE